MEPGKQKINIRRANAGDALPVWYWRNDEVTRAMSRHQNTIEWEKHIRWFEASLKRADMALYIGETIGGYNQIGIVRFDLETDSRAEVSIHLNPTFRSKGYSKRLLKKCIDLAVGKGILTFKAEIRKVNEPSLNLFKSLGFEIVDLDNDFFKLTRD